MWLQNGRFAGRTKDWNFKMFMFYDDEILEALVPLGKDDPSPEMWPHLERFGCKLYRKNPKVN